VSETGGKQRSWQMNGKLLPQIATLKAKSLLPKVSFMSPSKLAFESVAKPQTMPDTKKWRSLKTVSQGRGDILCGPKRVSSQ